MRIWARIKKTRADLAALGLFVVLACAYWWPLPLHLRTGQLESPLIDPAFVQWIIGWGAKALTHAPWRFFEAPMFFPAHHVLAWGDTMFAVTLLAIPLIPIFGLLAAYNIILIGSSAVSGFTLYLLAKYLFKNRPAAVVAGIIWAFTYSRYVEYGHLQILAMQWLPLTFLFAEKIRREYRLRHLVWFIVFTFLTLATNIYLAFFLLISLGIYLLALLLQKSLDRRGLIRLTLATLAAVVLAAPVHLPSAIINHRHPTVHADQYAATLDQYLPFPPQGHLMQSWAGLKGPSNLFALGALASLLVLIGVVAVIKDKSRPVYIGFLAVGLFAGLASFGPSIVWHSHIILKTNPFFYLPFKILPGYQVLRTPTRWNFLAWFGISVIAGLGFAKITDSMRSKTLAWILTAVVGGWIFLESCPAPIAVYATYRLSDYPVYQWLAEQPSSEPIMELPTFPVPWRSDTGRVEARRIFLSTYHWHPRFGGGMSPYIAPWYADDQVAVSNFGADPRALELIKQWHIKYIIYLPGDFDGPAYNGLTAAELKRRLDNTPDLKIYKEFPDATVYTLKD